MIKRLLILSTFCIPVSSCSIFQQPNRNELNNGYYKQHIDNTKQKVYTDIEDETIYVYPVVGDTTISINTQQIIDTTKVPQSYKKKMKVLSFNQRIVFDKATFDLDFLTIPLKFRPQEDNVPPQINSNLNGALYLGYRTDRYVINYVVNPIGEFNRNINHFGFSFGTFIGLGNTFISPTNTYTVFQQEYDGVIWSKGVAGIFAINSFTVGLTVGFDNLLDKNRSVWLYESKPWLGLAFGLNLN